MKLHTSIKGWFSVQCQCGQSRSNNRHKKPPDNQIYYRYYYYISTTELVTPSSFKLKEGVTQGEITLRVMVSHFQEKTPVDRSSSRHIAVACRCCKLLLLAAAATELTLRRRPEAAARVPPRGAAAAPRPFSRCCQQHLREGRNDETTI